MTQTLYHIQHRYVLLGTCAGDPNTQPSFRITSSKFQFQYHFVMSFLGQKIKMTDLGPISYSQRGGYPFPAMNEKPREKKSSILEELWNCPNSS